MSSRKHTSNSTESGDKSAASGTKRKGAASWAVAVVVICGLMFSFAALKSQGFSNSTSSSTLSSAAAPSDAFHPKNVQGSIQIQPVLPKVEHEQIQPVLPKVERELVSLEVTSSAPLLASAKLGWIPPPSQANYGKSNPRNLPRPPLPKQADNFLRARADTWEK